MSDGICECGHPYDEHHFARTGGRFPMDAYPCDIEGCDCPEYDETMPRRVDAPKFAIDLFALGIKLAENYLPGIARNASSIIRGRRRPL